MKVLSVVFSVIFLFAPAMGQSLLSGGDGSGVYQAEPGVTVTPVPDGYVVSVPGAGAMFCREKRPGRMDTFLQSINGAGITGGLARWGSNDWGTIAGVAAMGGAAAYADARFFRKDVKCVPMGGVAATAPAVVATSSQAAPITGVISIPPIPVMPATTVSNRFETLCVTAVTSHGQRIILPPMQSTTLMGGESVARAYLSDISGNPLQGVPEMAIGNGIYPTQGGVEFRNPNR